MKKHKQPKEDRGAITISVDASGKIVVGYRYSQDVIYGWLFKDENAVKKQTSFDDINFKMADGSSIKDDIPFTIKNMEEVVMMNTEDNDNIMITAAFIGTPERVVRSGHHGKLIDLDYYPNDASPISRLF